MNRNEAITRLERAQARIQELEARIADANLLRAKEAGYLAQERDQLRQDLATVISERRDAQNEWAHVLEDRDRLKAQLAALEEALEEARELAAEGHRLLLLALEFVPVGTHLAGMGTFLLATEPPQAQGCCRPGCPAPAEETGADGVS